MANLGYIQVTRRCNQRCRFCSNPELAAERTLVETKGLVDDLRGRGYDGVVLTGGEPTIAATLAEVIAYCVEVGLSARLITNGTRICEAAYLDGLIHAGLSHVHLSLHSDDPVVHGELTRNPDGFRAITTALELVRERAERVTADINAVITSRNADHLDRLVAFVIARFPFVRHFVLNGLDPETDRLRESPELVPRLADLEISLSRAAGAILGSGRTLRVERIPLCYMQGFEHCSTETRKIVKAEERVVHFLDRRGSVRQEAGAFVHRHHTCCEVCTLREICAGLYDRGEGYDPRELAPQFVSPEGIRASVLRASTSGRLGTEPRP
jgi:MoaA/NifB/PqqE/SkfB family radical SAM enzyme